MAEATVPEVFDDPYGATSWGIAARSASENPLRFPNSDELLVLRRLLPALTREVLMPSFGVVVAVIDRGRVLLQLCEDARVEPTGRHHRSW